mmetsp:Transcript_17413/g.19397  ORF Transcript_17413/g.19397 Transcript_17413/m.19397 type:complete len:143 (-) Transcript_17413:31-459(-)
MSTKQQKQVTEYEKKRIVLRGFSKTTKMRVEELCSKHGHVLSVTLVHRRGFAFVSFLTKEEAYNAVNFFDGRWVGDDWIIADFARVRKDSGKVQKKASYSSSSLSDAAQAEKRNRKRAWRNTRTPLSRFTPKPAGLTLQLSS